VDASIVVHGRRGILVYAPRAVVSDGIRRVIGNGSYEAAESKSLLKLIGQNDSVLELGAGLGYIASLVGTICKPAAYLAIEADPRLIPVIKRTLALNGVSAQVLQGAAETDPKLLQAGVAKFAVDAEFWASKRGTEGIEVRLLDLNAILAEHAISVIIADIEGGEATLFRNADLSGVRAVCLEIHQEIGPQAIRELFATMHAAGMTYDAQLSRGAVVTFSR
jgi:FkbM family methyltransferase